ncbi:MAG: NAD(P)/FAD-dependent oxidoreductase [Candidatus Nanoarchaeia archaeon]|nr:NAD(P)/FAD-dependent oxidoreductase [Candidatus Nanoarchaeia archaeon]
MIKVVILGGGFGGFYTVRSLCKYKSELEITLIDRDNYFTFTPLLHEVATAGIRENNVVYKLKEHLNNGRVKTVKAEIKNVDLKKKTVKTSEGNYDYDYLVIALGAKTNYYDIPGLEDYAYPLKTIQDAHTIRKAVVEAFKKANKTKNLKERKKLLTFVVVGAGATGIELVAELREFGDLLIERQFKNLNKKDFRVIILQKSAHMVHELPSGLVSKVENKLKKMSVELRYNSPVKKVTKEGVYVDGEFIPCNVKIAATGVEANVVKTTPNIYHGKNGIPVKRTLQINKFRNVFALGDIAIHENKNGEITPKLAQVATREAKIVANNIINSIYGNFLEEFEFRSQGFLLSVGQRFAVAEIFGIFLKGFIAWWLWRTVYLMKIVGLKNKLYLAYDWTIGLFRKRFVKRSV